jgi:hypothetical protein
MSAADGGRAAGLRAFGASIGALLLAGGWREIYRAR